MLVLLCVTKERSLCEAAGGGCGWAGWRSLALASSRLSLCSRAAAERHTRAIIDHRTHARSFIACCSCDVNNSQRSHRTSPSRQSKTAERSRQPQPADPPSALTATAAVMSSSESKDNGDATMQDEQQQQQRTEQQSEGGASPAPSAAAAAAATPAASDAAASENGSAAAAAAAASGASASTKKGKSKGKKEEVLEVDPNFEGQRFKVGELIFANYAEGKQWFEAKVLKVEKRGGQIYYYLHYQGQQHTTHKHERMTTRQEGD